MTGIITAIVVLLGIIALVQIVRIFEISREVSKTDSNAVSERDNDTQGKLLLAVMIIGIIGFFYSFYAWGGITLPKPASEHGVDIDNLWDITMGVIILVFLITQPILFYFGYKYRGIKGRKATYYEHNNKLELIWTLVPAVVLAGIILYGLSTWVEITFPDTEEDPMVVELYGKQFGWTARYAGEDNQLGYANVRMIEGINVLGIDASDQASVDDIVVTELHLPVGRPVMLKFRAQDVIHSAYLPHFRVQMNCVPGMVTQFQFTPTVTTAEMATDPDVVRNVTEINEIRAAAGEDPYEFEYVLLCNKICGAAHYNMQMKIVVEEEEAYNKWLAEQKTFAESL